MGCRRHVFFACLRVTLGVSKPFFEYALWGKISDVERGVVIIRRHAKNTCLRHPDNKPPSGKKSS